MHGFVNIVMDVHCEHQVGLIFPPVQVSDQGCPRADRQLDGPALSPVISESQDFVTAAMQPCCTAAIVFTPMCHSMSR